MSKTISDELNFLGTFATIDAVYDTYPSGGVKGNFVKVNNNTLYWDEDTMRWGRADSPVNPASQAVDGDLSVGGNLNVYGDGHFGGDVTIDGVLNVSQINLTEPLPEPQDGQSIFKSIVFKRSERRPSRLLDYDGTFYNPVPTDKGWSDGIPSGSLPIWMCYRVFTNDGESPQGSWSNPELMADTESFDVEFSDSVSKPSAPNGINQHGGSGTQVWFDPVLDASEFNSRTMIWMATRTRLSTLTGPTWGAWAILKIKGENGENGMGSENAYLVHPKAYPPIITNRYGDVPVTIGYTWQRTTTGLTVTDGSALWMSVRNYQNNIYSQWGDAVRISGDGAAGADGGDIEFIYKQMNRLPNSSDTAPTNIVAQDDYVPEAEGWYDEAKGVDEEHKCEWSCIRYKHTGSNVWTDWVGPFAWSVYGDRGMDGASVQFVFKRTTAEDGNPERPTLTDGGYINEQGEYIPRGWTDDPMGTNSYYIKEWVSMRRKGEQQTEWGPFSDPAVWSVYSETHSVEIRDGFWWIDGHNTGIRAEGEDGKGINLKGVRDFYSTSDTGYTSGKTTLQELTGMEVGDCYVVNGGDHAGFIYTYNGGTATGASWVNNWTELGEFRGTPGVSSFIHIAYAYNIDFDGTTGLALDTNTIYTDYSDIPISTYGYPDWIGIAVTDSDDNPSGADPTTASSYEWNHTRGKDGSDYERVYLRTSLLSPKPTISSVPTSSAAYQTNDYCPNCGNPNGPSGCGAEPTYVGEGNTQLVTYVFTDNPKGPDREWPYEWMSERKKVNGVWQAFSEPALWASFSVPPTITINSSGYWTINGVSTGVKAQGENGQGISIKGSFASKAALIEGVSNPSVGDCYYVTGGDDMGHLFFWDGEEWQDMGEIKGEAGQSQYMHIAWATGVTFSGNTATSVTGFTQNNAAGANYDWIGFYASDNPTAPDASVEANKLLYKWNYIKGMDGDKYEYVYIQTTTNSSPGVKTSGYASGYKDSNNHVPSDDEFLPLTTESTPREYTDDPHGTDSTNQFEWECYRRKNGDSWGAWNGPYLVHNWAKDGIGQPYVQTSIGQIVVDCDSDGRPKSSVSQSLTAKLILNDVELPLKVSACSVTENTVGSLTTTYPMGADMTRKSVEINYSIAESYVVGGGSQFPVLSSGFIVIVLTGTDSDNVEHVATTSIPVIANTQGAAGQSGPALRFRGDWTNSTLYTYNDVFRDCVRHNGSYWMLNTQKNGETVVAPASASGNPWTSMGSTGFIASELMLAESGAINLLSSQTINLFNRLSQRTASINADGQGSYLIYYPASGNRCVEVCADGYIYHYNDDTDNSIAWILGPSGDIVKQGVIVTMSPILLSEDPINAHTTVGEDTVIPMDTYYMYSNSSSTKNGKIYTSNDISQQTGEPTGGVINNGNNGTYATSSRCIQEYNESTDETVWKLPVAIVQSGKIVKRTTWPLTQQ